METKEFQNSKDFKKWARRNHILWREWNANLISHNFHLTNNPYSPHIVTLSDWNQYLISHTDGTVSIIDAKSSKMTQPQSKEILSILQWYNKLHHKDFDLLEKINQLQKNIIFETQHDYISQNIYPNIQESYNKSYNQEKKLQRLKKVKYINKLYNETKKYNNEFWIKNNDNTIDITDEWKKYFSQTIIQNFLSYNEKTNFLWRNWIESLFPNNIFIGIRSKLTEGKNLSLDEIADFIDYLLEKEYGNTQESQEDMRSRHNRNQLKSHVINMLYALMYTEQRYSVSKINSITKTFSDTFTTIDTNISKNLHIDPEDIYTEWWVKWLPSMAFKELRGEDVKDYMRWRTWINRTLLEDKNKKHIFVQSTFDETIGNIKDYVNTQWYDVEFWNIEFANKFNDGEITFDQNNLDIAKNALIQKHTIQQTWDREQNIRSIYKYSIKDLPHKEIDQRTKNYIQYAMDKDNSKTGWNGSYADIKFRLTFRLINQKDPNDIIENMSYEHMIVNMDSENEWGLSDHNIFLDPLKTIQSKLKISTAIDTDIFVDSVSWGIDKTIKELSKLEYYLNNPTKRPKNMSLNFINNQLTIRNTIPQEILDIAWLQSPLTYLEVDKNKDCKEKIEIAVATYLLRDQFSKGRLHWFIYDNDHIENISDKMQGTLKEWEDISYFYKGQEQLLQEALKNRHTGKYCLCWWWSNNLAKVTNSKLHSGKWYIGIIIPWSTDEIMFIGTADFSGIVNLWTSIKNNDIILEKINQDLITTFNTTKKINNKKLP